MAESETKARDRAKKKRPVKGVHVDGGQKIEKVDGYEVQFHKKGSTGDIVEVNSQYSK